jgi:hypothetical protein
MTPSKIAASLITLTVNIIAGVVILFIMLIAMNGYNESDAEWGLGAYIILAVIVTLLMSIGAFAAVGLLVRKKYTPLRSALIATPIVCVVGVVSLIVCGVMGIGIAEFVRVNY